MRRIQEVTGLITVPIELYLMLDSVDGERMWHKEAYKAVNTNTDNEKYVKWYAVCPYVSTYFARTCILLLNLYITYNW